MTVREKQDTMITSEKEQEKRWKEYFEEILNRPDPRTEISEADTNLEINTDEPSKIKNNCNYQEFKEQ